MFALAGRYMEKKCPLDDFELVLFSTGGTTMPLLSICLAPFAHAVCSLALVLRGPRDGDNGISYPLCPYCYNNPPFEDVGKGELRPGLACFIALMLAVGSDGMQLVPA